MYCIFIIEFYRVFRKNIVLRKWRWLCMHAKGMGQFSGQVSSYFPPCWRSLLFLLRTVQASWLLCFQMILSLPHVLLWLQICTTTSGFLHGLQHQRHFQAYEASAFTHWALSSPFTGIIFSFLKSYLFIICVSAMYACRLENNLCEWVLSFYHVGPRDQT